MLHLLKLCVGVDSVEDLEAWIVEKRRRWPDASPVGEHVHTTRMVPKRHPELVEGGSLYWVVRGQIACRQPIAAIRPFTDGEGVGRCHLVLRPEVLRVSPRPCRPFQGWRYLDPDDAPVDLGAAAASVAAMPDAMRRELAALGLL